MSKVEMKEVAEVIANIVVILASVSCVAICIYFVKKIRSLK